MRRRALLVAVSTSGLVGWARGAVRPVVLELFTSQGCSSCPPADALLGRLVQRPGVIALAWHVDYWDRLGWHDRFSSRLATARQQAYARFLGTEVFTPALVVNGASVVVGSDSSAVERAIETALPLTLPVEIDPSGEGIVAAVGTAAVQLRALRVVYDPEQETKIGAGENDGVRLREFRIAREAETFDPWDGSARRLPLPRTAPGQGQVVLVQSSDLRVLGATDARPG